MENIRLQAVILTWFTFIAGFSFIAGAGGLLSMSLTDAEPVAQCSTSLPFLVETHTLLAESMGGATVANCALINALNSTSFLVAALVIGGGVVYSIKQPSGNS